MVILQNINKYYHTETSVTQALRKVNLEFHSGEFVAITGESGSGKSTLLNVISGMDTFEDGELFIEGEPTFQFDAEQWEAFRREKIGFVFQDYHLIGHYSTLENIVSALLIMGEEKEEAEKRAELYLEKVGLGGLEKQRASELSSGQKQRLSIARALAKNTPIIMADEPTGNLDSETGEQIIKLLSELSEDRLVIMVTHNYEQAEPYVTRKVRLHDGEVVLDVSVKPDRARNEAGQRKASDRGEEKYVQIEDGKHTQNMDEKKAENTEGKYAQNTEKVHIRKKQRHTAWQFADMNRKTGRGRAVLFRTFFLFTAILSFVFIGELFMNRDDVTTRDYDKTIFYQKNDSRLSVQRKDGKELTANDRKKLKSVGGVVQVDPYDYVNDINYYLEPGKDYRMEKSLIDETSMGRFDEGVNGISGAYADAETPKFLKKNKFMRSLSCIEKADLASGKMPESRYEIVASDGGKYQAGDEMEIYFTSENIWGSGEYYHHTFKVSGLVKGETGQIYFHEELCHMLSASADGDDVLMSYDYEPRYGYQGENHFYPVIGDAEYLSETETVKDATGEKREATHAIVSGNYLVPVGSDYLTKTVEMAVPGNNEMIETVNRDRKGSLKKSLLEIDGQVQHLIVSREEFNHQSGAILEVSEEFFHQLYPRGSTQAAVYIRNYTKTDRVIKKLERMGYQAISTYRISSIRYNEKKVMNRLVFISISLGVLLVLVAIEILILRSIMKIRIKDFFVLKSMGMQMEMIRRISFYEMTRYCVEAMLLTLIIMTVLNMAGVAFISGIIIYYGVSASLCYILYNLLLEWATVKAFNRLL